MLIPQITIRLRECRQYICKRGLWKIVEWRNGFGGQLQRRYDIFRYNVRYGEWLDKPFMNQDNKITTLNRVDKIRKLFETL